MSPIQLATDDRRYTSISLNPEEDRLACGAWLWAFTNHHTDEATFTDWINVVIVTEGDSEAAPMPAGAAVPRKFWLTPPAIEILDQAAGSRSQAFRARVASATAKLVDQAQEAGDQIEPFTGRLPNKVRRGPAPA